MQWYAEKCILNNQVGNTNTHTHRPKITKATQRRRRKEYKRKKTKTKLKYIFCLCVQLEALEQMVDMTAKLFECDRDEMYNYLLRLCSKSFPFICLCALLFGFSVCGFDLQTAPPDLIFSCDFSPLGVPPELITRP